MKLKYNVLCVDDDISSLSTSKDDFANFNREVGIEIDYQDIEVSIGAHEDQNIFKARITAELSSKFKQTTFDLILVDLHMTGGIKGDDVIKEIRKSHTIYRPIIFYSAGNPTSDEEAIRQLNKKAEEEGIFGKSIFITSRNKLIRLLKDIAEEMHKEEHKINQVRGLLMDRVSEIDAKITLSMIKGRLWEEISHDKRERIVKKFKDRVLGKKESSEKLWEKIEKYDFDAIKSFFLGKEDPLDMNTKSEVLREVLRAIPKFNKKGKTLSEFYNNKNGHPCLAAIRNLYAHKIADHLEAEHNDERCRFIREESRRHLNNIESIYPEE